MLMQTMEESLQQQSSVGFSEKDIDDVRRWVIKAQGHVYCIVYVRVELE
jgi:hypothetical protein